MSGLYLCLYILVRTAPSMNSPFTWLRTFFAWVLTVDTPPYPYESWHQLPQEQWPQGYDPLTDTIARAEAAVRVADAPRRAVAVSAAATA